jgi:hypothetical protein
LIAYTPENKNNLPKEGKRTSQTTDPNVMAEGAIVFSKDNNKAEKSGSEKINKILDNSSVTTKAQFTYNKISQDPLPDVDDNKKEKGGLKEFLRKTTRVFERRTKIQTTTDDNKLLLGAFAVSLK